MSQPDQRRPTPRAPNAAGPGNAHDGPPCDAPGPWGTGALGHWRESFDPEDGKPAADPAKVAAALLAHGKAP
jgi:hypothetical protein